MHNRTDQTTTYAIHFVKSGCISYLRYIHFIYACAFGRKLWNDNTPAVLFLPFTPVNPMFTAMRCAYGELFYNHTTNWMHHITLSSIVCVCDSTITRCTSRKSENWQECNKKIIFFQIVTREELMEARCGIVHCLMEFFPFPEVNFIYCDRRPTHHISTAGVHLIFAWLSLTGLNVYLQR